VLPPRNTVSGDPLLVGAERGSDQAAPVRDPLADLATCL
jgi:hypothetical protein